MIRIRMSTNDAHYAGNLVDGAKILEIFGDLATELLIRSDGDEGLFLSYDNVEFIAPVYAGDFIEAKGEIIKKGNTSRKMEFEAHKVITSSKNAEYDSACDVLDQPVLVSKATGTCVVLQERQRDL
ncbi:MAG: 3-aminobutyryl-CoA ammonia lyase [Halanaerobiales bacterium]|nr:3-aminobutyryl-CoA ammonia lyase [Halanaerobiales bacterium]